MRWPIVADGAMGTMLMRAGLRPGESGELWNLTEPAKVEAIQRAYVEAGAGLLTTNTFGGTPAALSRHGLADRVAEINREAVGIARRASGGRALVFGDVGPLGILMEPYGEATPEQAESAFRIQISALAEAGADGIIVETMVDGTEMEIAVRVAREFGNWPIIATYAFQRGFHTFMGTTVKEALWMAIGAGADVVGANCGTELSLADYLRLATEMLAVAGSTPLALQVNAGTPESTSEGLVYRAEPALMAECAHAAMRLGVVLIGGCCGTTPEHIRAMAEVVHQSA